jgi:23S rRNA (uridine2552-2'-O)-methyltransferase
VNFLARSKTSKAWMREHVTDPFVKRANAEGYRSRAAYKLQQLAAKDKLLRPGMTVVDLGAAPGGWSQVAAQAVSPGGYVVALDILEIPRVPNVTVIQGDFHDTATLDALDEALEGRAVDLVLSDMAPNMSGIASVDQARSLALAELAFEFALNHLKPGGNFLVKVFQGAGYGEFLESLRRAYAHVYTRKPEASRSRSSEVYVLGKGLQKPAGTRAARGGE